MLYGNLFVPTDVWPEVYIAYSDGTLSKIWYSEWLCYVVPVYANNGYRFTHLSVNNAVYICSLDSNKNIIQNTGLSQNNQNLAYTTHENANYICVQVARGNQTPRMFYNS